MHLARFSNDVALAILDKGRLMDLLRALCIPNIHIFAGHIRGNCPVCDGKLAVFINETDGKTRRLPLGWSCNGQQCHRKFHPSLLGLTHAALSAADAKEVPVEDAVLFLREFMNGPDAV